MAKTKGAKRAPAAKKATAAQPKPRAAATARPRRRVARRRPETLRLRAFSPGLTVSDLEKSLEFYTEALGFVVSRRFEHEGKLVGALLTAGICELGIGQDDWARGRRRKKGEGVRIWCETAQDIDAIAERVRSHGGKITDEPADRPWGVRAFSVDDLDGYHLTFYKPPSRR